MGAIKHTLTERYYTWEDAIDVARNDPEISMDGEEGEAYTPSAYEDEIEAVETLDKDEAKVAKAKPQQPVS